MTDEEFIKSYIAATATRRALSTSSSPNNSKQDQEEPALTVEGSTGSGKGATELRATYRYGVRF